MRFKPFYFIKQKKFDLTFRGQLKYLKYKLYIRYHQLGRVYVCVTSDERKVDSNSNSYLNFYCHNCHNVLQLQIMDISYNFRQYQFSSQSFLYRCMFYHSQEYVKLVVKILAWNKIYTGVSLKLT